MLVTLLSTRRSALHFTSLDLWITQAVPYVRFKTLAIWWLSAWFPFSFPLWKKVWPLYLLWQPSCQISAGSTKQTGEHKKEKQKWRELGSRRWVEILLQRWAGYTQTTPHTDTLPIHIVTHALPRASLLIVCRCKCFARLLVGKSAFKNNSLRFRSSGRTLAVQVLPFDLAGQSFQLGQWSPSLPGIQSGNV